MDLFAVCPPGLEATVADELRDLGFDGNVTPGGVELQGEPARVNLWSRTASRVLVRMGAVKATAFPELVRKARALPWEAFVGTRPVALRATCRKSRLYHSGAVAQRLHEAMQEGLRRQVPLVEDEEAGQLFVARFDRDLCTVSADSSGALLHQRGWRASGGHAPLRETLAAAVLRAAGYRGAEPLLDPLCGSGTIAIEGALVARRRAPGIGRRFAFQDWPGYDAKAFAALLDEARSQELPSTPPIVASDIDAGAVQVARDNAARAGVEVEEIGRAHV